MVLFLVLLQVFFPVFAQDEANKGICNRALGLSSGALEDGSISGAPSPFQGRLENPEGAWCFTNNESVAEKQGVLTVDLGVSRFVSGFASQGPPEKLRPKSYSHVVGYLAAHSTDGKGWTEFNGGRLIFDNDGNNTSDVINYFVSSTVFLSRYVRINVTMQVSGPEEICMRFEIYGCDTDVQPLTNLQAITTPKGQIEVNWNLPTADTTLGLEFPSSSTFRPSGYTVMHRPMESKTSKSTVTSERTLSLGDVRLGATYVVQLRCLIIDASVDCGSTEIEAYPPCPEEWTGGNEYHCFLFLGGLSSFQEARETCLRMDADDKLGKLSSLLDDSERKFMADRILPEGVKELWLVGDVCQENDECCKVLQQDEEGILREIDCAEQKLKSAVCVRDHKGEGSRIRVSSVKATNEGTAANVTWQYEGSGWKTDKLQARLRKKDDVTTTTYSTLEDTFLIEGLEPGIMYSLVLKPAPNIRTEEFDYNFILINFGDNSFGALLTPVPMSVYVVWSGSIRVTWSAAHAQSVSGQNRESSKYSISFQDQATESDATPEEVIVESGREFRLTPLSMKMKYVFRLGCLFAGVYHPCGEASVTTDPPAHIQREVATGQYTLYEVIGGRGLSWFAAEEDCTMRSGHLTSLLNEAEGRLLLEILPSKEDKVWTGAKLKQNGVSYWTDGNKITFLPMAKNSGVLPDKDSCCRALYEYGRLKLEGGECGDTLKHICKYSVKDIMRPLASPSTISQTYNSLKVGWKPPEEGWLPTFYVISVCERSDSTRCRVQNVTDPRDLSLENLSEFTAYDVMVKAVLQPLNVTTSATKMLYTYPKSPVGITISTRGEIAVSTPMLVAIGMEESKVIATVYREENEVAVSEGDVKMISVSGLVPEESYRLVVASQTKEWMNEINFDAIPSCAATTDVRVGSSCCRLLDLEVDFKGSESQCLEVGSGRLWAAESSSEYEVLTNSLESEANFWVSQPSLDGIAETASEEECPTRSGDRECCSYVIAQKRIVCSYCCDAKQGILCAYDVIANLGQVSDLLPNFIGNTSIGVRWSNPNEVTWNIQHYEVQWRSTETEVAPVETYAEDGKTETLIEDLEFGTEYEVTVTPLGKKKARGEGAKLLVTTLDPRPQLTILVQSDGVTLVRSPILTEKGRGGEEVDLAVMSADGTVVAVVRGVAERVEVTGLEPGMEYIAEMTPAAEGKPFKYKSTFSAFPSCPDNHIQDGLVCLWSPEQSGSKKDAAEICRSGQGELLDFRTQKTLAPAAKARLAAQVQKNFWVDFSSSESGTSESLVDAEECAGVPESDIMCCTFEATSGGDLNDIKCTCCTDPRPFACKKENKVNLGDIGDITVEDVTQTSLKLGWTLASDCKWQQPSFLVTWDAVSTSGKRGKREAPNQIVVKDAETTIADLEPGTSYRVGVSPYTDSTQVGGSEKEITVSTRDEVIAAGFTDTGCTTAVLKISCCISVILSTSFTVFVFIATRMFDLDCVAQMFMELSLLGAYLCILVSSAHTYSMDNECARASASLCVAVAALIQFFFQCAFLFLLLESGLICAALKGYMPDCCTLRSPLALFIVGFGIPAVLNIVIAAIESDEYTDKNENCWLNLRGRAVLPSVLPVLLFSACSFFFLVSAFDADEPRENLPKSQAGRARVFLKTRWSCFAVFALTIVSYATGLFGANKGRTDPTLNYVFFGFSLALAVLLPLLRIRCDDQVKYQLRRGLFASLRDDVSGIRVTPAPENNDLLQMAEFSTQKFNNKQISTPKYRKQMSHMTFKRSDSLGGSDVVLHR